MSKNYASIINNGTNDYYVKDAEAKRLQTAKSDPTKSGTTDAFIDSITQNANGEITATKKGVNAATEAEVRAIVTDRLPSGSTVVTGRTVAVPSGTTTLSVEVGKYYRFEGTVGTLAVTLPAMSDSGRVTGLALAFTTGSTPAITISSADSKTISYFSGYSVVASTTYELNVMFNGTKWIAAYGIVE